MYVCICRQVTDKQVKEAIAEGATTMRALCQRLPIGTQCGRCCVVAKEMIAESCSLSCQKVALPESPSQGVWQLA